MRIINMRLACVVLLSATFALPQDARAYVDPNSSGLLYQLFFPLLLAATVASRWIKSTAESLWRRIRRWTD
jgi:hypothetical protein